MKIRHTYTELANKHGKFDYQNAAQVKGYRVESDDAGAFYYVDPEGNRSYGFASPEGAWRAACEDNDIVPVEHD
jgi:hypothetical protein